MYINLTPHEITIKKTPIAISGNIARVILSEIVIDNIDGIDIISTEVESVNFNYVPNPDDILIVSSMVLDNLPKNHPYYHQTYAPDTGSTAIRNDKGQILAVTRLKK